MNDEYDDMFCKVCGGGIPIFKTKGTEFCSDKCRLDFHNAKSKDQIFSLHCFECQKSFETILKNARFCSNECRWKNHKKDQRKDNAHIDEDAELVLRVAQETKQDPSFVSRLFRSCKIAGFDFDLAVKRYCKQDLSIKIPQAVLDAHKQVMDAERRQDWGKAK